MKEAINQHTALILSALEPAWQQHFVDIMELGVLNGEVCARTKDKTIFNNQFLLLAEFLEEQGYPVLESETQEEFRTIVETRKSISFSRPRIGSNISRPNQQSTVPTV